MIMTFKIVKKEFKPVGDKIAFVADLLENGKVVGEVRNNGTGTPTYCRIFDGFDSDVYKRLMSCVTQEDIDKGMGLETYFERQMAKPCGMISNS